MKNQNQNRNKNKKSIPKSSSHQKSKQKSSQKGKKFNPLEYLNALIELTNESNGLKIKRNKNPQKRDLSSALTIATPAMEQTISTSKLRCKSSYSQYRKKSVNTNNLNDVLNVKLNDYIITEEEDSSDCIKFTSTSNATESHQTPVQGKNLNYFNKKVTKLKSLKFNNNKVDYNYYAIKIQRAWRSYMTYKMIHKYYRQLKKQRKYEKKQEQLQAKSKPILMNNSSSFQQYQKNPNPNGEQSFVAYLDEFYDASISRDSQTQNKSAQILQRTIKFKLKKSDQFREKEEIQKIQRLKGQNSQSGSVLNLTQKLDEIKKIIQKEQSSKEQIEEIPTVEMKKYNKSKPQNYNLQPKALLKGQKSMQQLDDSETQKKKKPIIENPKQQNTKLFLKMQRKQDSPKIRQSLKSAGEKSDNTQKQQKIKQKGDNDQISLVDNMIKKQTQKYNQILSLIEGCKSQNKQQSDTSSILLQLLSRLKEHKQELESSKSCLGTKKTQNQGKHTRINTPQCLPNKHEFESFPNDKTPECIPNENSFLAFQNEEIYHSFQIRDQSKSKFESKSESKLFTEIQNQNNATNINNTSIILVKDQNKQLGNGCYQQKPEDKKQKEEVFKKFSTLLVKQEQKLKGFICRSQKQKIQMEINLSEESIQESSINSEKQLFKQIQKIKFHKTQSKNFQFQDDSSIYSFCSSSYSQDEANKMFKEYLNLISMKKEKSIENLNKLVNQNKLQKELYPLRLQQIENHFNTQKLSIQQKKNKYLKTLHSVKKQALQFQKDLILSTKTKSKKQEHFLKFNKSNESSHKNLAIRKSFSAESMVLKSILKQPIIKNKNFQIKDFILDEQDSNKNGAQIECKNEWKSQDRKKQNEKINLQKIQTDIKFGHKQKIDSISISLSGQEIIQRAEGENYNSGQFRKNNFEKVPVKNKQQVVDQGINKQEERYQVSILQNQHHSKSQSLKEEEQEQVYLKLSEVSTHSKELLTKKLIAKTNFQELQGPIPQVQQDIENKSVRNSLINNMQGSPQKQISSTMMQKCSQELQKMIEKELYNEFLSQIYLNDSILKIFKPFIQEIFDFTQITDSTIINFIQNQLTRFFPPPEELIQKANQKINPTSLQILKLVRDFDFYIDEYDLFLSQDVFKKARKQIEAQYQQKAMEKRNAPIEPPSEIKNQEVIEKIIQREKQKRLKVEKYLSYQRDMKIMYMKAIFNCLNEFLIEQKSIATHVNSRSTIGVGQLSLSIKQFNIVCGEQEVNDFFARANKRIKVLLRHKCMLPVFRNQKDVGMFQHQMLQMIRTQFQETEYKWVSFMDEVLQIWNQLANQIVNQVMDEAAEDIVLLDFF